MTSKSDLVSTDRIIFVACDYVDAQTVFGLHLIQRLQSLQNEKYALVNCRYPEMFIFGLFVYFLFFFLSFWIISGHSLSSCTAAIGLDMVSLATQTTEQQECVWSEKQGWLAILHTRRIMSLMYAAL